MAHLYECMCLVSVKRKTKGMNIARCTRMKWIIKLLCSQNLQKSITIFQTLKLGRGWGQHRLLVIRCNAFFLSFVLLNCFIILRVEYAM